MGQALIMADPKPGERKTINGVVYEWNGREGVPIGPAPGAAPRQQVLGAAPPSVRGDIARGEIAAAQAPYAGSTAAADARKAQADAAKAEREVARMQQGAPLDVSDRAALSDGAATLQSFQNLLSTFDPRYGGNLAGGVENRLQGLNSGIGTPGQRNWWADFSRMDAVQRNKLFGASLTATEKAAWEDTTVSPNMSPDEIRRNLMKRAIVVQNALARQQSSLVAGGFSQPQIAAELKDVAPLLTPEGIAATQGAYYKAFPDAKPQTGSPWSPPAADRTELPAAPNALPGESGGQMGDVGRAAATGDFRMTADQEQALMALANDPDTPPEAVGAKAAEFARAAGHEPDAAWVSAVAASVQDGRAKGGMRGVQYPGAAGPEMEVRPTKGKDGLTEIPSIAGPGATSLTGAETGANAVINLLPSAASFAKDTASAVVHPVETVKTIGSLAAGALSKTGMVDADEATVDALGKFYADRYGSVDGFKRALADDPVGILADASAVLSLGGGTVAKVGEVSKIGAIAKTGRAVAAAGRAIDPINAMGQVAGLAGRVPGVSRTMDGISQLPSLAAKYALGATTGVPGGEAYGRAAEIGAEVGRAGGQTPRSTNFLGQLRGGAPIEDVVSQAEQVVNNMQRAASADYQAGMANVAGDATILNFHGIDTALDDLRTRAFHGDKIKNPAAAKVWTEAKAVIDDWKAGDPAEYHTPTGMDALKQRLGGIADSAAAQGDRTAATIASGLYGDVRQVVADQVPTYAATMKSYEDAQRALAELKSTFGAGNHKASVDTKLRKLQSIMRNNANTNYGRRAALGASMDNAAGGAGLLDSLAAQSASSIQPRGLMGAVSGAAGLSGVGGLLTSGMHGMPGFLNPGMLAALPLTSPRIMGEASYFAGKGAGTAERFAGPVLKGLVKKYRAADPTGLYGAQLANAADSAQDEKGMIAQLAAKYAQSLQMPSLDALPQDPLPLGAMNLGTGDIDPKTGLPMQGAY
jgi:hypothetical protein